MKVIVFLLGIAFLGTACSSSGSKTSSKETAAEVALSEENLAHINLDVKGMTCEGCENAITASINKLDGIQEATASHTKEEVVVVFDSTKTSQLAIEKAIADAGYSVAGESADPHH